MKNFKSIKLDDIKRYQKEYDEDIKNTIIRHSLSKTKLNDACYSLDNQKNREYTFSIDLKTMPVTNQKQSGRCWIFSASNLLRERIAKELDIEGMFEISQNYIAFYDKLEKINYVLESIIDRIDQEPSERKLMFILQNAVGDGGQWDMFVNIIKKYGICPKSSMVETCQSSYTSDMNSLINVSLRNFAYQAQNLYKKDKDLNNIYSLKEEYLKKFYALLVDGFGVPPTNFDFEYTDKKHKYHIRKNYTPKSFYEEFVKDYIDDYVSIIHAPTKDKEYNKTYTVEYLGNVIEGKKVTHLNLPLSRMKELIIDQLKNGDLVWFGSDVSKYRVRDEQVGLWDDKHFDYESCFGLDVSFEKDAMLDYSSSCMNHAMVLTGVNLVDGKPNRWKVENSWGKDVGNAGYFIMSDTFFDKFVYQAAILKDYLNDSELQALKQEPIMLQPWDPFGTLAD